MVPGPAKKLLPNWALGALLGSLVAGTYVYSIKAVGDDSAEVFLARHCKLGKPI